MVVEIGYSLLPNRRIVIPVLLALLVETESIQPFFAQGVTLEKLYRGHSCHNRELVVPGASPTCLAIPGRTD